tara:strand:+ start:213 stop:1565 length:1353 start_codon:yes stop_codon:yes gene_type:complete
MYSDFRSLEAISAMVNIILGTITLILASRTKKNAWNELFAAKLLGWYFIFMGISMMSNYLQGQELWRGPSTYTFVEASENTKWLRFNQMVENVTFSAAVAIMCSIPLFFPYPFLQSESGERIVSVFILLFTLVVSGFSILFPFETSMVRFGLRIVPLAILGFVYVRFSMKELKYGEEGARSISSSSGLLILAMNANWMTDWLWWITILEKWSTPVWVNSIGPDAPLEIFFIRQSLNLGVTTTCLLAIFFFEAIRTMKKGNSVLSSLSFGFFIVGIISWIADYSILDTLENCIYATCDGLPEEWLIYNTFTNNLARYIVGPIVLMFILLNYDLVDTKSDENGSYARAMVIVLVVIATSTVIEMIQSIIPIGEIITSAILAIGIAAAIGWEKAIMEKFLSTKNSTSNYLMDIKEILHLEFNAQSHKMFMTSIATIMAFTFILSLLNAALGLG